ncbi:MAG: hypothetical protein WAV26_01065 [Candidatus Deferrimicrobium sp.]
MVRALPFPLLLLFLPTVFFLVLASSEARAADRKELIKLKNLYISTTLVEKGQTQAVIVAPRDGRYAEDAGLLVEAVRMIAGVAIPVLADDAAPEELLRKQHVIVLGNMATNAFIETMYRQWYVIMDLKYPGEGGFVVRSLHNPYGTGHNVIFLGGSDDSGVKAAVDAFVAELAGRDTLKVGWLMKIRLGKGMTPPAIAASVKNWNVRSWNDSRRKALDGEVVGYEPATYFGWNPVSIAGALYYMTGAPEYLETFKELALPDTRNVPLQNRTSDAFNDPSDPLVKNYHYRAHLVDCVYDLIEESPLFSDSERLAITNKLLEHQKELDPDDGFSVMNGDRHALWHMVSIYTGSRYFSRHYPDPAWDRRMANVRRGFRSFLGNPTWAERDTLGWVSTSIDPVFEFFLLDGYDEFVESGTARTMMRGLEVLMSGAEVDDGNRSLAANLLNKAAFLLKDGRFVWMYRLAGFDSMGFRIGQSWWQRSEIAATPPLDLVNRIVVAPLARSDLEQSLTTVSATEGFQLLSWRGGLKKTDDYLLLDGYEGLGRHPYQVNTLLRLRMFQGKEILSGYANDLAVWRDGMTGPRVSRSAALKDRFAADGFAYIHTEVPEMSSARWERHFLYVKDREAIVLDRIVPEEPGRYDIVCYWQLGAAIKPFGNASRQVVAANSAVVASATVPLEHVSGSIVQERVSRTLAAGEPATLANLLYSSRVPKTINPVRKGYFVSGIQPAFIQLGPDISEVLRVQADLTYIDRERLFLSGATGLVIGGEEVFSSDVPISFLWDFRKETTTVAATAGGRVRISTANGETDTAFQQGGQMILSVAPSKKLSEKIRFLLERLDAESPGLKTAEPAIPARTTSWKPAWETSLDGIISALVSGDNANGEFWAIANGIRGAVAARLGISGDIVTTIRRPGEILSAWPARGANQVAAFGLLAGFRDDTLRAFADDGRELLSVKSSIHPSFIVGDRYDAPWFTDPNPPNYNTGVYSLLVGDPLRRGREEIVLGRPCTLEFRRLDGALLGRTAIRWGNITALTSLSTGTKAPMLLAGKGGRPGIPTLTGIDGSYRNLSDDFFGGRAPDYPDMHAWQQRGVAGLLVADIDRDGREEVVYTLSGHWNELRVYDSDGALRWMRFFGPGKDGTDFMRALVLSTAVDGRRSIVVGTKNGWVIAFDPAGRTIWRRYFTRPVTAATGRDGDGRIAVGCEDGTVEFLDGAGGTIASGSVGSAAVTALLFTEDAIVAGSRNGTVRKYPLTIN